MSPIFNSGKGYMVPTIASPSPTSCSLKYVDVNNTFHMSRNKLDNHLKKLRDKCEKRMLAELSKARAMICYNMDETNED